MPTLPIKIITFFSVFAAEFTKTTWGNILLLAQGAILCRGSRRITTLWDYLNSVILDNTTVH